MNYCKLCFYDVANGPGFRTSLFVSGCTHHCEGCFNKELWDFTAGVSFDQTIIAKIIESLAPKHIRGLTVLGGEPMELKNQKEILPLLIEVKKVFPQKDIWIYSGYTWEELTDEKNTRCHGENTNQILALTDTLVDGKFILAEKDVSLQFRGSRNQRIIDVQSRIL